MKKSELGYVRKRKRRRIVAITSSIAAMTIGVFVLVSFLGRFVGTFTVALDTGELKLSLCEKSTFDDPTSYIKLKSIPKFGLTTFTDLPAASELDNEENTYSIGTYREGDNASMRFFKYTFFVKNSGSIPASYDLKVNLTRNVPSSDNRYLDSLLRVIVYHNAADSDDHAYDIYAKKSDIPNQTYDYEEGELTFKEPISFRDPDTAEFYGYEFPGFAEMFESDTVIARITQTNLEQDEIVRYTLVAWLEGYDKQTEGSAPEDANLKLGVTINAYENQ